MPVIDLHQFPPPHEEWPYPPGHSRKAEYDARVVACARVVRVMCYPDSEEDRREFLRSIQAWTAAEAFNDDPPLPSDMAPKDVRMALADGLSLHTALSKAAKSVRYEGALSGEILLFILRCAEHSPKDMSVLKAVDLIGRALVKDSVRIRKQGGRTIAASRTVIMNAWTAFRPVAHFWAAVQLWKVEGRVTEWPYLLFRVDDLLEFIALAEDLRHRGEALYAHGQKTLGRSVLDPSATWRAPDCLALPNVQVTLPPLTDQEKSWLKEYRA